MLNYSLLFISMILYLAGIKYTLQNGLITKKKALVISMTTTLFLCYSIIFLASDYFTGEGVNDAVIYHLQYGLANSGFQEYWLLITTTATGVLASLIIPYVVINRIAVKIKTEKQKAGIQKYIIFIMAVLSFLFNPTTYGLANYFQLSASSQHIQESSFNKNYRNPKIKQIAKKKNLVFIYAESLERTYFDESVFPGLIKELRRLEAISTSFTQIKQVAGTGWTVAGMTASQCGIPLVTPSHGNSMSGMDAFLPNAICLGDLLAEEDYKLSYSSGSSVDFAGSGALFNTHGFTEVKGRTKLQQLLPNKYYQTGWGLYDDSLFDITFNEFSVLSKKNKPFGLFISTMDTHHPNGHPSKTCQGKEYQNGNNPILNAVACSDYLISEFVNKIIKSDYAKNTIIVVASDHLAMRNTASDLLKKLDRNNLFLIIAPNQKGRKINKQGSMLDVAPSLLPYLGYEGDIGLGRNLLSNEKSLAAKTSDFNSTIATWKKPLQDFWGFPKVDVNDDVFINAQDKTLTINKRVFKYPLLIEFEENHNTTIRFEFNRSTEHKSLSDHFAEISRDKPFLWIGRCNPATTAMRPRDNYCINYGRTSEGKIKAAFIQENFSIPIEDIYNPIPKENTALSKVQNEENRYDVNRFIAHAGGKINGTTYTNSLEALDLNYQKGFRLFELDIIKTSDNIYVAAHDWQHWQSSTGFTGDLPPTRAEFKQYKIKQQYTPLDIDDINTWYKNHPDAILVTDKVNTPLDFSKAFIDKRRLMMELFTLNAVKEGRRANIKSAMPTWSLLSRMQGNQLQTLLNLGVTDIAASRRVIADNKPFIRMLKNNGIKLYVFHVNFDEGKNEDYVVCRDMDHIYGLYADEFDFQKKIDCSEIEG